MSVGIGGGVDIGGAGHTTVGKVLGLIGGSPIMKSGDTFINKLKAAKTMESGDISGLMDKVMGGQGLDGLLKNPMANKGGQAKSKTSAAASDTQSRYPNSQLSYALKDLDQAVTDLVNEAANVVGLGGDDGSLISMVGYVGTLGALGDDPTYSESIALKPALSDAEMDAVMAVVDTVPPDYYGGNISEPEAVRRILEQTNILRTIIAMSQNAVRFAQDYAVLIASASAVASLLQGGSEQWQTIMDKAILDTVRPIVDAINLAVITLDEEGRTLDEV